jgi:hypothetical protein
MCLNCNFLQLFGHEHDQICGMCAGRDVALRLRLLPTPGDAVSVWRQSLLVCCLAWLPALLS